MKSFLHDSFFLDCATAERLYFEYAEPSPIIDYHNHLSPELIDKDHHFSDLTEAWLDGDHYKWRAMRANGVGESYITGDRSSGDKFQKWAETVPYTLRNPLYIWTHLELRRYFGINSLLDGKSAIGIFQETRERLQEPQFSTRGLLEQMNVKVLCTTDDPLDSLEHHRSIQQSGASLQVYPTFRPDRFLHPDTDTNYGSLVEKLSAVTSIDINSYQTFREALISRMRHFSSMGCRLADHGITRFRFSDFTYGQAEKVFGKVLSRQAVSADEGDLFRSALLFDLGQAYHAEGWVQQFHLGATRNNNQRLYDLLGPDIGCDSMGDYAPGTSLASFLSALDKHSSLPKTILYNLNPRDNALFATMAGNFNDGLTPGKMQYGASWWFLDQKEGIEQQLQDLSNFGLLSRFIGMLTDSRSFLSFPRHEYFRRILCNMIGRDVEAGLLPNDLAWLGSLVQDICYNNVKQYMGFHVSEE